jgi:septal ring factor EnvC (AmiA/AmiB activator)
MTNFLSKYYREILLVVFAIALTFVLIKVFTPAPDKSELLKYKLNQLDKKIEDAEKKQKQLDDSIAVYKESIKRIDANIADIRSQKTTINNYYENKGKEIVGYTNKQIDSALTKRYNY